MSVNATYALKLSVVETLETNVAGLGRKEVVHDKFDSSGTINATSTVPATKAASFEKALAAGVGTIDLTALTGVNGGTVDFTGLKVQVVKFQNPATNTGAITVTFGATNPYLLKGSGWKTILQPGEEEEFRSPDKAPDVSGTTKNIDLAGSGTEKLNVVLVAG